MSAPSLTTGVGHETARSVGVELPIANLTCPTCVQSLESALRAVPGVMRATVNLATARAFVEYDPKRTGLAAVHEAMRTAGYRVGTAPRGLTKSWCRAKDGLMLTSGGVDDLRRARSRFRATDSQELSRGRAAMNGSARSLDA